LIGSDSLAIGVLRAFNDKNIAVPDTTAFISINDIEIAKFSSPALTTFKINISDMIDEALNLLHQKILNPKKNISRSSAQVTRINISRNVPTRN